MVHLTLKIFSLYFVFGNSVFVYKTLSVIIRNLSNFWLSLGQPLPTHVTIETAQELCHFIHNTCIQMGIQAIPVALPRSLWTPEVCGKGGDVRQLSPLLPPLVTSLHSLPSFGPLPPPHALTPVRMHWGSLEASSFFYKWLFR